MVKPRVNLRLPYKLHAELERRTSMPGVTKAKVVEDALSRYFDPEGNLVLEERLLRRMDAHALGQRRFDHFIQQLAKKLGNARGVAARLNGMPVQDADHLNPASD